MWPFEHTSCCASRLDCAQAAAVLIFRLARLNGTQPPLPRVSQRPSMHGVHTPSCLCRPNPPALPPPTHKRAYPACTLLRCLLAPDLLVVHTVNCVVEHECLWLHRSQPQPQHQHQPAIRTELTPMASNNTSTLRKQYAVNLHLYFWTKHVTSTKSAHTVDANECNHWRGSWGSYWTRCDEVSSGVETHTGT
jgi:hypothetical protein